MPDLSTISSGLKNSQYTNPVTSERGGYYDGTKGSWIARTLGNGYYDKGLQDFSNQKDVRYQNQGWIDSVGNFAGDVGVKTISGVPAIIGGITGLAKGSYSALTGGNFSDGFDDNPFMNMADSINAYGDEVFPHFQEAKYQDMSFGQKLFSAPGQLATSNVETVGFLAQSFGLAGLLGKAQFGTRIVNELAKGKNFAAIFSELSAPNLAKIAGAIDEVSMNAFLTTNESAMEGIDAKKSVIDRLHADRLMGKNTMSDEEIERAAGNSLGNVFWLNMLTGAATNGFFAKLTKPIYAPSSVQTRANKLGFKMMTETDGAITRSTNASGFEKFLFDEGHAAGMTTKRFFQQGISEGLEEDIQYSIQKVNDAENLNRSFLTNAQDLAKDFLTHGLDFSDDARLEATALGSIMGAGGIPIMAALGKGAVKQARTVREARELAENEVGKAYTDFMSSSILSKSKDKKGKLVTKEENGQIKYFNETEDRIEEIEFPTYQRIKESYPPNDKGEYIVPGELPVDAEGNIEIDKAKAAEFAASAKLHAEYDNYIDTEASKPNADDLKISLYQLAKLKHLAQMSFKHGTTDLLLQKLDSYTKLSPEKLQRAGIANPEEIQQLVDRWKKHVTRLESNYLSTQNALLTTGSDTKIKAYRDTVAELGGRIVNLDTLVEDVDKQIEDIIKDSPISTRLRAVQESFQQTDDVSPLFPYQSTDETTAEETKIAELATKRKDLVTAREELGTMYSKMMEPKKGFKAYQDAKTKGELGGFGKSSREKSKKIAFNDLFTEVELENYLDKTAQILQHKDKVDVAKSAFYADAINLFVKYLAKTSYTTESADSLKVLVNKILDNKFTMYPDEVEKLRDIITSFVEGVNTPYNELMAYFEAQGEDAESMDYYDPITAEDEAAYEKWMELKGIKEALGNLDTKLEKVLEDLENLKGFPEINTDSEMFRVKAAEALLNASKRIVSVSEWDGETISSEYDNVVGVRLEKEKLSTLINKGLTPLAKKNSKYDPVLEEAKDLYEQLKRIEVLAKANSADKDLKNKQEDLHYANGANSMAPENVALQALIKTDPVLGSMATMDLLAQSEPEVIAALKLKIYQEAKTALEALKVFELTSFPSDFKLTPEQINIMLQHPTKGFGGIFELILRKESSTVGVEQKELTALENFVKDYDVVKFKRALESGSYFGVTTVEQLQSLLLIQTQLAALEQIQQTKDSGFNNVSFLNLVRDYLKKNPDAPTPSTSQIRVVRELSLFAMSPNKLKNEMYENGAALKAPAGAGKSLVISKLLKHVLKLSGEEILTAAAQPLAAKNIKESVNSPVGPLTVQELTDMLNNNSISKDVKLIIIDEVGALLNEPINKFAAAFAKHNRENPDAKLKFLFLYDPNQITPGNVSEAVLDRDFMAEPALSETAYWTGNEDTRKEYRFGQKMSRDHATLPFIENIQIISPLSVTYRSDVAEIVDLQNAFKTERVVEDLFSAASSDPLINTTNILGSKVETENTIAAVYSRSEIENPGRTRSILVGSEAKRQQYLKQFPTAEVLTVPESQGITRDEIYVDVQTTDGGALAVPKVFNAWMYTAISRASLYAQVANTPQGDFKVDAGITEVVDKIKASRENKTANAVETITQQIETLSKITEDVITDTEEPTVPVEELDEEDEAGDIGEPVPEPEEIETADEGIEVGFTEESPIVEGTHSLLHPTSEVLSSAELEDSIPALQPGDTVLLVKDISPKRDGSPALRYMVVQPIETDGVLFAYRTVAILGESEVGSFASNLNIGSLDSLRGYRFQNAETGLAGLINPTEPIESSIKLFIQPTTSDIQYVYSPNPTDDFSSDVDAEGRLEKLSILETYFKSLYGEFPGEVIENYDEVLRDFDEHTKIISFKSKKEVREWFPNSISDKQRPKLGPPYLVIHKIKSAKTGKPMNNQFIRLTPSVLNKNTPDRPDFQLSKVYEFLNTLTKFEKSLTTSGLPGVLTELRNGRPVVLGKETYYPFHSFIVALSRAYQAKLAGKSMDVFMTDAKHLTDLFPSVPADKVPVDLMKMAYEMDVLIHGEVGEGETRAYNGAAQKAMDAIGKQNFITTLKDGTNLILRDFRKSNYKSRENREVTNSAGLSLLGPVKFLRKKGLANNPLIKDRLTSRLKDYSASLTERGLGQTKRADFVNAIIKAEGVVHLNPVTTEQLQGLFVGGVDAKGSFSQLSEGFGLRTPLGAEFNSSSEATTSGVKVKDVVQTHYVKTNPTRIVVGLAPNMIAAPKVEVEEPKKLTDLQTLIREVRDTKATVKSLVEKYEIETVVAFIDFMAATNFTEAISEYRKNSNASQVTTAAKNIYQSLKDVGEGKSGTLMQQLTAEIETSLTVEGVGRDKDKIASRDFIRGAFLVRLMGANTQKSIMDVSDIARIDYYSGKNRTPEEFTSSIVAVAEGMGITNQQLVNNFNNLIVAYKDLANSYKVPTQLSEIQTVEEIFSQLEEMVANSSALRKIFKNTADPALPTPKPTLVSFAKRLVESAEDEEAYTALLEHPENADFKRALGELTDEEDYYSAANKAIEADALERSQRFENMDQELGEELTPAEVEELMTNINPPSLVGLFKSFFKKKSSSEVFRMFQFGQLVNSRGETVWGLYKQGAISYALNANGKIGSRTVRHEMFHKIFWEYLTPAEQTSVLILAKEKWGNISAEALEEKMAVDFETFVADKKPNVFQVFWQKLMRLLGFTVNNLSSLNKFFNSIQGGVYNKRINKGDVERSQINIAANFNNLGEYLLVKNTLLSNFLELETARGLTGRVLSFPEIIKGSFERLADMRKYPEKYFPKDTPEEINAKVKAFSKVLDNIKLSKSFVDTFFGQAQTRDTLRALYDEKKQRQLDELLAKEEQLQSTLRPNEVSDELDAIKEEIGSLTAETFDTELSDPAIKLTGNVKQRLISIKYLKDGEESYAALGEAFSIILPRTASIPVDSMENALKALKTSFEEFGAKSSKLSNNIRTATGRFMLGTVNKIINKFEDPTILKNIAFRKDASSKKLYAIVSLDGSPAGALSLLDVQNNKEKYRVVSQVEGETTHDMINNIAAVLKTDYASVAKAYYLFEDLDFVRSLLSAVSSLRESLPYTGIDEYKYGQYIARYLRIKTGGGRQIHESYITNKFDAYTRSIAGNTLFSESLMQEVNKAEKGELAAKKEALKNFLNTIGVKRSLTEVSAAQLDIMFEGFYKGLEAMQAKFKAGPVDGQSYEEYVEDRRGVNLFKTETKILRNIVDVINNHYQLSETHSYTRADGKKAYGWIDGSYQSQVLTSISRALNKTDRNLAFKSFSTFKYDKLAKKLVTTDRFLSNNIYFNGTSTLTGFIDHDGLKTKGNDNDAVFLTKESLKDFRKRNIVFGFFSKIGFGSNYFQFLPIPSNRTTIQAVEVKALKKTELDSALLSIINAQKNRPDIKDNPDLAATKTYRQNWKQWKLAGLTGNVDAKTAQEALNAVKEHAKQQAKLLSQDFKTPAESRTPKIRIPDQDLQAAANYFALGRVPRTPAKTATAEELDLFKQQKNEIIEKALELFYLNYIVNQYSASQLLYGDEVFYKSKEDQTKRIQIVTATGDTLLTDEIHGIPPTSRILVAEDLSLEVPTDLEGVKGDSYRDVYDASDAEGFMLPEFYEKIARAYGIESLTDIVMKPVYFSIENGIPTAVKYSVKVLTDELVDEYPHLNTYREAMRKAKADQMVFKSAVKVGLPTELARLDVENGNLLTETVSENNILTLNNSNLRFQLNPSADTDKDVANPSQGVAFMNTNGQNFAESFNLFKFQSFLITNGLRRVARSLRLTRKGGMSPASKNLLSKKIMSSLEGLPGGRDVLEMLQAVDPETKRKASLNLPLISERVVSSIASFMSKATTGFKFEGSKLVLQADLGQQKLYNDSTGKWETRKLKFRDEQGFCEVILPESYREFMNEGDSFIPGSSNGIVGFRIPSTNYHSLLPLKVVGFYPTPVGSKGNIVIAPSLVVYYHGSDYDIDSLFVIRKEKHAEPSIDLNEIVSSHLPAHEYTTDLVLELNNTFTGFGKNGAIKIDDLYLHEYLEKAMNQISKKIETLTNQLSPTGNVAKLSIPRQTEVRKQIEDLNSQLNSLASAAEASAKNHIVDLFSKNMLDFKNRADLLTPISFKAVKGLRSEINSELSDLLEKDDFIYDLQKAGLIDIIC